MSRRTGFVEIADDTNPNAAGQPQRYFVRRHTRGFGSAIGSRVLSRRWRRSRLARNALRVVADVRNDPDFRGPPEPGAHKPCCGLLVTLVVHLLTLAQESVAGVGNATAEASRQRRPLGPLASASRALGAKGRL